MLLALLLLGGCGGQEPAASSVSVIATPAPVIDENIIHGAGEVAGYLCSNSLEALTRAWEAGCRFIEIDFSPTADGAFVCLHDWNTNYLPAWEKEDFPLTLAEFEDSRIYGALTPLTLTSLIAWLETHEDVYIVTDGKDGTQEVPALIAAQHPTLVGRFIPQIYAEDQLVSLRALGYDWVIYTLYLLEWEDKLDTARIAAFARENALAGITFPWELAEREGYVKELLAAGIPLFTHTVNGAEAIAAQLSLGITAVYTDYY